MVHRAARGPELALPANIASLGIAANDIQMIVFNAAGTGRDDTIADDDWTGDRTARHGFLPGNLLLNIIVGRQFFCTRGTRGVRATKLQPIGGDRERWRTTGDQDNQKPHYDL